MKKKLAVVVAIALVLCLSSAALADEILFRKIPWFSNHETVMETCDQLDVTWGNPKTSTGKFILPTVKEASSNSDRDYPCVCTVSAGKGDVSLQVAGYDVTSMTLYFAYVPGKDGVIDRDLDDTSFYMARYTLKIGDYDLASKDLMSKLNNLYGKPKTIEPDDGCDSDIDQIYKWTGDKDTFVYLAGDSNQYGPSIKLYYGTAEGDTLIKNAEKIQRQQDLDKLQENGSDGL